MYKILILQNTILHYRKTVFNRLSEFYDVTVLHSGKPTLNSNDLYREIVVPCYKCGPFFIQGSKTIRRLLSNKYDIIVSMFDLRWPAYLFPSILKQSTKWIVWGHQYSKNPIINIVRDWIMKRADSVLLYGPEEITKLTKRGIQRRKIFVAYNTIHVPNHHDYSDHPKTSLLFVGTFKKRKGIESIIKAFYDIQTDIFDGIKLEIVGDGSRKENLVSLVNRLKLSKKVIFHGHINNPNQLWKLFSRSYAYISLSLGLGALHSFAYGVPVITKKSNLHGPEFHNIKDNINSLVYDKETTLRDMMKAICISPNLSSKLGKEAYKHYINKRTLDHMIKGFKQAIEY